jgi:hypothetical protein
MLNASEKAYCLALVALRQKNYRAAATYFDKAAPFFADNAEFSLLHETTRLLLAVKGELVSQTEVNERIEIEEVLPYGKETKLPR